MKIGALSTKTGRVCWWLLEVIHSMVVPFIFFSKNLREKKSNVLQAEPVFLTITQHCGFLCFGPPGSGSVSQIYGSVSKESISGSPSKSSQIRALILRSHIFRRREQMLEPRSRDGGRWI